MGKLALAGDVGGTKTLLQLLDCADEGCRVLHERRFDSQAWGDFNLLVREFLHGVEFMPAAARPFSAACFGVAGPIHGHSAKITNLPWTISAGGVGAEFGIDHVELINDFAAVGYGIEALEPDGLVTLQQGEAEMHGTRVVLGAGTGLGEGILVWRGTHYDALPSEGGHVDFAPVDEEQVGLLHYLQAQYGHVSYERILSGAGLAQILEYLVASGRERISLALRLAMQNGDPAAAISEFGLDGRDAAAQRALDMFIEIYGAQAGNLALTALARGGVYVAGGIAPKIITRIHQGGFIRAFGRKGRFSDLMQRMPVHVVMNSRVGLLGAAQLAARLTRIT